jgi:2,4-dienoyl-CoA reductase-like NADH-dependent reductase (Old Yellow Enzyme family)
MERRKETIEQGGWNTVAPSAVAYHENEAPLALDKMAFKSNTDFKSATKTVEAGFQVMEIHAAHGYLMHQFFVAFV